MKKSKLDRILESTSKTKVAQGWRREAGKKGGRSRQKSINEDGY